MATLKLSLDLKTTAVLATLGSAWSMSLVEQLGWAKGMGVALGVGVATALPAAAVGNVLCRLGRPHVTAMVLGGWIGYAASAFAGYQAASAVYHALADMPAPRATQVVAPAPAVRPAAKTSTVGNFTVCQLG